MKKLLAMLFAGLLLITSMSVMAWADDEDPIDDIYLCGFQGQGRQCLQCRRGGCSGTRLQRLWDASDGNLSSRGNRT